MGLGLTIASTPSLSATTTPSASLSPEEANLPANVIIGMIAAIVLCVVFMVAMFAYRFCRSEARAQIFPGLFPQPRESSYFRLKFELGYSDGARSISTAPTTQNLLVVDTGVVGMPRSPHGSGATVRSPPMWQEWQQGTPHPTPELLPSEAKGV